MGLSYEADSHVVQGISEGVIARSEKLGKGCEPEKSIRFF